MSRVGGTTALRVEDYPAEQRSWLPRLFTPLNLFITTVNNILNGRVQFGANIPSVDTVLTFNESGAAQRFRWSIALAPVILWVGQATEDGLPVLLQAIWSYDASNQMISVSFVKSNGAALTAGVQYRVVLRIVP
jgi:hypothetical protein